MWLLLLLGGTVMVQPPEPAPGTPATPWVAEAVAALLPRALADLGVPVVERDDRIRAQEALEIPLVTVSNATAIRIAEAAGADRLVLGTYTGTNSELTLSLRILDVERATLSAPLVASGPLDTAVDLLHGLAFDLALAGPTPPRISRAEAQTRHAAPSFEALKAHAQGLAARDVTLRARYLRRALALQPSYEEARLSLARLQMAGRDFTAAQETLARVAPGAQQQRTARFLQGVTLLEMGRYRDAEALFAKLAPDSPTPAILCNRALALLRLGQRASHLLQRAVEAQPACSDLMFDLGFVLLAEGEPEAAAFWLAGAKRRQPLDTHARVVLSWALRRAGKTADADAEWKGVVALSPAYAALQAPELARRFERLLYSERLPSADREVRSEAEMAAGLVGRAERALEAGDADGALRELTRAAYMDPYSARVHLLLARSLRALKDDEKAENELRMSLWSRDDSAVRLELAGLLRERGRAAEARAEAQKVLKLEPGNAAARRLAQD